MNVLLSCAGRRNYLMGYFREALGRRGKVYAADLSPYAPAMLEAGKDAVTLPAVDAPSYFDELLKACVKRKVRLLVSLNDFELPGLSRHAERFKAAGVVPMVSPPDVSDLCFDKWRTFQRLRELEIPAPETVLGLDDAKAALADGRLRFPLIVKPRWGTASVCVERVLDEAQLIQTFDFVAMKLAPTAVGKVGDVSMRHKILVQQAVEGPEYGVDIINDLGGRHQAVIVKRKLSMRAGETDRAKTERHPGIAALAKKIGESLGAVGLMDCDAFDTPQGPMILELNPRFGGGYPFSHAAGANVPAALLAWADGKKAKPAWLKARPGVLSAKCDRLVTR